MTPYSVGILLFNEVEVLDFAGPFEVFSLAGNSKTNAKLFDVQTVSENGNLVIARNDLQVQPNFSITNHPAFDLIIIPGGYGAEEIEIHNERIITWIQQQAKQATIIASVCTGALLLAKAGLLNGLTATTHWMDLDRLEKEFPHVLVQRNVKFVDEDTIITSGGISAGINMSFHLVSKLCGQQVALETAKRMEYDIEL
ncbi:MAG: DJ-1/PfpI family protein [Kurthia sp.]|nr:DJ-1/PfpI family protein [Candidatus Kurthia equi]